MKKLISILLTIALLPVIIPVSVALASDITDAVMFGTIRGTNSGTIASDVSANLSVNTADWIDDGTMSADADNVAIRNNTGVDTEFMPGYDDNPWVVQFDSVPDSGNIDYTLYTNVTGGQIEYFPGPAGATVADAASMEPSANFTISVSGWLDTDSGTDKNSVYKNGAIRVFVEPEASENITAQIPDTSSGTNTSPTSGTSDNFTDITKIIDGNTGTDDPYGSIPGSSWSDYLELTLDGGAVVAANSARVWSGYQADFNEVEISAYYEGAWHIVVAKSAITEGQYTTKEFSQIVFASKIRIRWYNDNGSTRWLSVYEIDYNLLNWITATVTDIPSGESDIVVTTWPALSYNGTQYLVNSTPNFRSADSQGAIESWFIDDNPGVAEHLFSTSDHAGAAHYISLGIGAGDVVFWQHTEDLSDNMLGTSNVSDGNWHHVVFNSDGSTYTCFLDGEVEELSVDTGANTGDWFAECVDRDSITIGVFKYSSLAGYTDDGYTGATRVYSRPILVAEALTNYQRGRKAVALDTTGLVYNLPTTEGTGDPVDTIGSLTMTATATWTQSLSLGVDNLNLSSDSSVMGASVPNTTANWTFFENNAMPYVEAANITVGGNLRFSFAGWEYAETFTDASGGGNTMTPSFRTTSSDADVSTALISFAPITLASAIGNATSQWPSIMADAPDEPSTAYSEKITPGIFFAPLVHTIAEFGAGSWSRSSAVVLEQLFWYGFAFFFIMLASIGTYYAFAANAKEALFVKIFATAGVMIFFALPGINIYGLYVPMYYIFFATGILMLKKDFGW